jgi:hypothetical protein
VLVYRLWKYGYTYRRIYLGEGKFTIVDPPDYYWLNYFHWCASGEDDRIYAARFNNNNNRKPKTLLLHREIVKPAKGLLVDHRNGNRLDNRRTNLRFATRSENQFNKCKTSRKTPSRFKGVFFEKQRGKWSARIGYYGKRTRLGYFDSEIDAAKAYDEAAKKYHGEFARLNFPEKTHVNFS